MIGKGKGNVARICVDKCKHAAGITSWAGLAAAGLTVCFVSSAAISS